MYEVFEFIHVVFLLINRNNVNFPKTFQVLKKLIYAYSQHKTFKLYTIKYLLMSCKNRKVLKS